MKKHNRKQNRKQKKRQKEYIIHWQDSEFPIVKGVMQFGASPYLSIRKTRLYPYCK